MNLWSFLAFPQSNVVKVLPERTRRLVVCTQRVVVIEQALKINQAAIFRAQRVVVIEQALKINQAAIFRATVLSRQRKGLAPDYLWVSLAPLSGASGLGVVAGCLRGG